MTGSTPERPVQDESVGMEARANRVPWPPLIYLGVLLAAVALGWFAPLRPLLPRPWDLAIGLPLAAAGLCIAAAALLHFRRVGTPVDPTSRARVLAAGGIYRVSRNPMYLGAVLTFLGLGLAGGWTWLAILACAMPALLWHFAIRREEVHLTARFGEAYIDYARRVRRWL